ncbi:uncharacterized protein K452DRAFT_297282 [Aplosporella prunicola CBS 121167]|uniref:Uncharacterized protein n=1 Tax=Aplosporella prunicola CBS 121167 TaxID=1176127 RepID=A0A6A6BHE1_9PEZI|nr:uncharacterized protein K452DRAFT_297282 [Aplosporella prunicola CBS 121167]KAF2142745.1 hypothetical protein K452DRAFT_297282 [Aplosporella prunicola CBS 121167]
MPNMQWNHEADAKLLAAILKVHSFSVSYQALAEEMGQDCTPKAVTHRIAKLKAIAKGSGNTSASAPSTPRKPRTPAKKGATTDSSKKRKRGSGSVVSGSVVASIETDGPGGFKAAQHTYDEDDDDDEELPVVKREKSDAEGEEDAAAVYAERVYGDYAGELDI